MKKNINNRGSTLIFTVITIFLIAILVTAMLGISVANYKFISQATNLNNSFYNSNSIAEAIIFKMYDNAENFLEQNLYINTRKKILVQEMFDLTIEMEINGEDTINGVNITSISNLTSKEIKAVKNEFEELLNNYPYCQYDGNEINYSKDDYLDAIVAINSSPNWQSYITTSNIDINLNNLSIDLSSNTSTSAINLVIDDSNLYNSRKLDIKLKAKEILDYQISNDFNLYTTPGNNYNEKMQYLQTLYDNVDNNNTLTLEERLYLLYISGDNDLINFLEDKDNSNFDNNLFILQSWKIVD